MRVQWWLSALALAVGIGAAPGRAVAQGLSAADARTFAGCYAVARGAWTKPVLRGPPFAPLMVRLDTLAPEEGWRGHWLAARVSWPAPGPGGRPPMWRPVGADSVEIMTWGISWEADVLYLRRDGELLRGVLRRTSDAIPVDSQRRILWDVWPRAPATVRRVACPAE